MSIHIKNLLKPFIQNQADWKVKIFNSWQEIMGKLANHATIEKIYQDTIVLGVYDSCWLQELYLLSPTILQTINNHLEKPYLKQIRFKQTTKKQPKAVNLPHKKVESLTQSIALSDYEKQALARIKDDSLKHVLESFLIRCYREK